LDCGAALGSKRKDDVARTGDLEFVRRFIGDLAGWNLDVGAGAEGVGESQRGGKRDGKSGDLSGRVRDGVGESDARLDRLTGLEDNDQIAAPGRRLGEVVGSAGIVHDVPGLEDSGRDGQTGRPIRLAKGWSAQENDQSNGPSNPRSPESRHEVLDFAGTSLDSFSLLPVPMAHPVR